MISIERETAAGQLALDKHDLFKDELSALGVPCLGVHVHHGRNLADADDPTKDRLVIFFASPPDEVQVDAAIAAFPSTGTPVEGTFAATTGDDYLLDTLFVREGESVALDIHLHVAYGNAANIRSQLLDYYACVERPTGGSVRATDPTGSRSGNIPGFAIKISGQADRALVYATLRATGTLTIINSEVAVMSRGMVPA